MSIHTDVQIITRHGKPAFAVVPYDKWLEITGQESEEVYIPHEVVGLQIKHNLSLIAAWRKYRKLTQAQLGEKTGISQAAVAQIESTGSKPHEGTLQKLAVALQVSPAQLTD